jgi:bifunctional non-homologous end joining protein LigD
MALDTYRRKRDFRRTPEPQGRHVPRRSSYRFVIQKHAARRLHYDFRLELDGALKSWAVPKGPSLDPRERRLAVHVEDHPIEYGTFEGVIPKREYGAGPVIVWDRGTWEPEGDPFEGYRQGKLHFTLHGEKLRGAWRLVRTNSHDDGKEQWLLVKSTDEYVSDVDIIEALPHSVQSGRTIEDVAEHTSHRPAALPKRLRPQLATLVDATPNDDDWLHEIKYDGYRVLCRLEHGHARLYSRNGHDLSRRMAAIADAVERLSGFGEAWLDGEVVALGADGRTNFSALQAALSERRDYDMVYYVFDLPYVDGADLTSKPLFERKERLATLLRVAKPSPRIRYSDHVRGDGRAFYRQACEFGLEGVISKRIDSPYRSTRTRDWVKTKCRLRQEFVVGGYTDPAGTRRGLGALLLGVYSEDGELIYCGRTGTGFDDSTLDLLYERLSKLKLQAPAFAQVPREARKGAHWVKPVTVVEVEFTSWTNDGMVRQASYQGIREDKAPKDVVREVPSHMPVPTSSDHESSPATKRATPGRLTNPQKVLYPEVGLTKEDIASYYAAVSDWILPYVSNRPLTLVRCPEGRAKDCFFQKHATETVPDELRRIPITNSDGSGTELYLAVDDIQGVLALVQMGVLEIHVWGARADKPEVPDQLVFDFDPDAAVPWAAVVDAAVMARRRLRDLGLTGFLRTTGGKGLHVVVPIARRLKWPEIKNFTKAFAEEMVRLDSSRYTARLPLAARKGKIFVDYLRNGRGATAIASYSTRARPNAPVSVPLDWKELTPTLAPGDFTVRTVPERLRALKRDPWEDFDDARRVITRGMMKELGVRD